MAKKNLGFILLLTLSLSSLNNLQAKEIEVKEKNSNLKPILVGTAAGVIAGAGSSLYLNLRENKKQINLRENKFQKSFLKDFWNSIFESIENLDLDEEKIDKLVKDLPDYLNKINNSMEKGFNLIEKVTPKKIKLIKGFLKSFVKNEEASGEWVRLMNNSMKVKEDVGKYLERFGSRIELEFEKDEELNCLLEQFHNNYGQV
ncbi:hypothetical protein GF385_04315 [Candidatus Dependentiae bacterium]|nr:hypothetical protein [Candidatus Dependentiae bacterium]